MSTSEYKRFKIKKIAKRREKYVRAAKIWSSSHFFVREKPENSKRKRERWSKQSFSSFSRLLAIWRLNALTLSHSLSASFLLAPRFLAHFLTADESLRLTRQLLNYGARCLLARWRRRRRRDDTHWESKKVKRKRKRKNCLAAKVTSLFAHVFTVHILAGCFSSSFTSSPFPQSPLSYSTSICCHNSFFRSTVWT